MVPADQPGGGAGRVVADDAQFACDGGRVDVLAGGRAAAGGTAERVPTGSLPDLLRAALAPLAPAPDAAEDRRDAPARG